MYKNITILLDTLDLVLTPTLIVICESCIHMRAMQNENEEKKQINIRMNALAKGF